MAHISEIALHLNQTFPIEQPWRVIIKDLSIPESDVRPMHYPITGIILAGGQSKRFDGENKALFRLADISVIDCIYDLFRTLFTEVIVICNSPLELLHMDAAIVADILPISCSLTGIHTGLFAATQSHAFFSACDTPFLKKDLVKLILDHTENRDDVVIPETSKGLEPLCAVYSKRCLKPIEEQLRRGQRQIRRFFDKVRVKRLDEPLLRQKDPDLSSFFNINTPDDFKTAQERLIKLEP